MAGAPGYATPAIRRRNGPRIASVFGVAALVLVLILLGKACSAMNSAKSMTCHTFLSQTYNQQASTIDNLLIAHNLKTDSASNILGATAAVSIYCGSSLHANDPIDKAVDWSSKHW